MKLAQLFPILMLASLPTLMGADGCNWPQSSGPPASPPTAAAIEIDMVEFYQAAGPCSPSHDGKVRFTPIQLTGAVGTKSTFTLDAKLGLGGPNPEGSTTNCIYSEGVYQTGLSLETGRWKVEFNVGIFSTSCEVDLEAGVNLIKFSFLGAGCTLGPNTLYPK